MTDEDGFLYAEEGSNCLGADCGAGVWLMLRMIAAGKEGLYVFHRNEENGGIGSDFIASETPELLRGIDFAIAFDRFGTQSIITHQGARCCSDAFAISLGEALGMPYQLDPGGTFTDTANYTHLVPECTNISVGYYDQHRPSEAQDTAHLQSLLKALLALDLDRLVAKRLPSDPPDFGSGLWSNFTPDTDDDAYGYEPLDGETQDVARLIRNHPGLVAEYLVSIGITSHELDRAIDDILEGF